MSHVPLFTKQYKLVPAIGRWGSVAGKVTVGLASHWPCVTDSVIHLLRAQWLGKWEMSTQPKLHSEYYGIFTCHFTACQRGLCVQDIRLLSALLEVVEQPHSYFEYADSTEALFPASFIRLLRAKVIQFFERNSWANCDSAGTLEGIDSQLLTVKAALGATRHPDPPMDLWHSCKLYRQRSRSACQAQKFKLLIIFNVFYSLVSVAR